MKRLEEVLARGEEKPGGGYDRRDLIDAVMTRMVLYAVVVFCGTGSVVGSVVAWRLPPGPAFSLYVAVLAPILTVINHFVWRYDSRTLAERARARLVARGRDPDRDFRGKSDCERFVEAVMDFVMGGFLAAIGYSLFLAATLTPILGLTLLLHLSPAGMSALAAVLLPPMLTFLDVAEFTERRAPQSWF
jgi:hypothetical protein